MAHYTPSRLRRKGRNAYYPGATTEDSHCLNPWRNDDGSYKGSWWAESNSKHWMDGWDEAATDYARERKAAEEGAGTCPCCGKELDNV